MRKYITLFGLSLQKQLEVRSDFFFERTQSMAILVSTYFLWKTLIAGKTELLGYSSDQLLTYVLLMVLLRSWVLACITWRLPSEISKGKLSELLLRPISQVWYWAVQDLANKVLNVASAVLEVGLFMLLVKGSFRLPEQFWVWPAFALSVAMGVVIYFQMSYMLGVLGFWTSQSWGPRFCFEILMEFCAGSFFPIDLLPLWAQRAISTSPFPYLVYYPASIFLERLTAQQIFTCYLTQVVWIALLSILMKAAWNMGLKKYAAEGG